MQKYERVEFKDLKIGDHFTWLIEDCPQHDSFILTGIHNDGSYSFNLAKSSPTRFKNSWICWKPVGSDYDGLIRYLDIKLSKEDLILEKIKYLDKKYELRRSVQS